MSALVGRTLELKQLTDCLASAESGRGFTILVSGEAGVGKTRLVEECAKLAESKNFKVMNGQCMHSSLTPYFAFREMLCSGGHEHLIGSETPPRLETVFLITNTGLLISKCERVKSRIDSDIFTGMLTAVTSFIEDSIRQMEKTPEGNASSIRYGNFNIAAVHGRTATIVSVFTGRENEFLLNDMESVISDIEHEFGERIRNWRGKLSEFEDTGKVIRTLLESEKYEGIDWAKDDPKSRQSGIFENVSRGLAREARKKPLFLFLDDLQWADPSTLALFHYVSRNLKNSRVLLIGAYRPEDITQSWDGKPHQLTETMQLMGREGLIVLLGLGNLTKGNIGEIVGADLGALEGDGDFVELLWTESQGNPLFVVELIDLLKEEGGLVVKDGGWKLSKALGHIDIPTKIHDVISRRLAKLLGNQREILESASVIGDFFSSDVLEKVVEIKRIELLRSLNEIEKVHRLIESVERKYRFAHVKIRDVLYSGLSEELKREYHLLVGDTKMELYGATDETVSDIGYQYYMAKNAGKAIPLLVRAIESAKNRYSNEEASKYCEHALELMHSGGWKEERMQVLESLGDILEILGKRERATAFYGQVLESSDEKELKAKMQRKICGILIKQGKYDDALARLEESKNLLGNTYTQEFGRIQSIIGLVHEYRGDYDRAISYQQEAMKIFALYQGTERDCSDANSRTGIAYHYKGEYNRALDFFKKGLESRGKLDDQRGLAALLNNIGIIHFEKGEYDDALECYSKCLRIVEKIADLHGIAGSCNNLGNVFFFRGELDKALEYFEKSQGIREKLGDQRGIGMAYNNMGTVLLHNGEYSRALELLNKSVTVWEKIGNLHGLGAVFVNIGNIFNYRGEYERAIEFFEKSLNIRRSIGDSQGICSTLHSMGDLFIRKGEYDRAYGFIEDCLKTVESIGNKRLLAEGLCTMSRLMLKKQDFDGALERASRSMKLALEMQAKDVEGVLMMIFGIICADGKEFEKSIEYFEKSLSILGKTGRRKELAEAYLEYGVMLGRKGDKCRSKEMLEKALGLFEGMGILHRAGEARKGLDGLMPPG
jgi:predicted ATPase